MTYTIAEPCVDIKDKACIEECPVDCIYEGARMLYIHPDECVDCGACEPVCPVEAIYYEDDVPDQWSQLHPDQRGLLRRARIAGRRVEGRPDRQRSAGGQGPAAQGRGLTAHPPLRAQRRPVSASLPVFPWDTLAEATATARAHPDGIVDLSVGTPVDPVAPVIREALAAASGAAGYPTTAGTPALRASAVAALRAALRHHRAGRACRAAGHRHQGTHRLAADPARPGRRRPGRRSRTGLPDLRGRSAAGRRTGGRGRFADPARAAVAGRGVPQLTEQPDRTRCSASSTCARSSSGPASAARWWSPTSATWGWAGRSGRRRCCTPRSATATTPGCWRCTRCRRVRRWPAIARGSSPVTPAVVAELLAVRKHAGMMVPTPVQAAMVAALDDDVHEQEQRERYARPARPSC